jgi:hypothetical protein
VSPERWTPAPAPQADLPPGERSALQRRARWGAALVAVGVAGILWGALHVVLAVGGPERADFAHRPRYDEVKPVVHRELFGGLVRSLTGLAVAIAGGTLRGAARRRLDGRPPP